MIVKFFFCKSDQTLLQSIWNLRNLEKKAATEVGIQVFSLRFAYQMQQSIYNVHQKSFHAHKMKKKNFRKIFFPTAKFFRHFRIGRLWAGSLLNEFSILKKQVRRAWDGSLWNCLDFKKVKRWKNNHNKTRIWFSKQYTLQVKIRRPLHYREAKWQFAS